MAVAEIGDTTARQALRLRELYELTSLGGDYVSALDNLVARAALTFNVSDCVMWGPAHEPHWPRTARKLQFPEEEAMLLWRCDLALTCVLRLEPRSRCHRRVSRVVGPRRRMRSQSRIR